MTEDERFMREALAEAREAAARDEVPVGAVVVLEGVIVGRGANRSIASVDPTAHAEVDALRDAARTVGNYRLTGATVVVTVEPCLMCAGALVHARVGRLVYGAPEPKAGAVASVFRILEAEALNHRVMAQGGVLEQECRELMQAFFATRRDGNRTRSRTGPGR